MRIIVSERGAGESSSGLCHIVVETRELTLFSSEGILSTTLGYGDEEQGALGNFRPVSSKLTRTNNVLRPIVRGVYSPTSVELDI